MKIVLSILVFVSVCFGGAFEDGIKAAKSGDFKKAHELWEPLANQGDATA